MRVLCARVCLEGGWKVETCLEPWMGQGVGRTAHRPAVWGAPGWDVL